MDMTGEQRIPAPKTVVWDAILDPEVLKACIPGCEKVTKTSDTEYTADVVAKVGPVKAKFSGAVTLADLDPPNGCTISGEGKGGPAGFAKGSAKVALAEAEGGTLLTYTVAANVGGKLAQIGSRLIDGVARKMADDFFTTFNQIVTERAPAPAAAAAPQPAAAAPQPSAAPAPAAPEPTPASTSALPPLSPSAATQSGGLPTWVWVLGLIVIVVAGLLFFGR